MNRILVVEDDPRDAELLLHALEGNGIGITTCTTAQEAREVFSRGFFHAVMVNLKLPPPEPDGLDLIRWLRRQSTEVLIVVVTGADDPRKRAQAIEAGATGFFEKPYTSDDNLLLLHQIYAKRAAYRKGKEMKHWRTSISGACTATGLVLFGGPIAISTTKFEVPSEMNQFCIWGGLILTIAGTFLGHLFAADKREIDDHVKDCTPTAPRERQGNRSDIGLPNP